MRVVYKYPIDIAKPFAVDLPIDHTFLKAEMQNGSPQMWILVDPELPIKSYQFVIVGTGQAWVGSRYEYLDTFQSEPLVWHLFKTPN